MTKVCRRCQQVKPVEEFPVCRRNKDGLYYRCKLCKVAEMREVKARPESERRKPAKVEPGFKFCYGCQTSKLVVEFYRCAGRPDGRQTQCRVCKDQANRQWVTNNPKPPKPKVVRPKKVLTRAQINERYRELYAANPVKYRLKTKKWRDANPDKVRASLHVQRSKRLQAEGTFTQAEWRKKKAEYGNRCAYCLRGGRLTVHHVIPLSKGGSNWICNIVPTCLSCNCSIGAKTVYPEGKDAELFSAARVGCAG
jgi:5-methylcytosine-specific restriction endonuclease McrA